MAEPGGGTRKERKHHGRRLGPGRSRGKSRATWSVGRAIMSAGFRSQPRRMRGSSALAPWRTCLFRHWQWHRHPAAASSMLHEPGTMIFVGSLGYRPNVEGLLWFAEKSHAADRRIQAAGCRGKSAAGACWKSGLEAGSDISAMSTGSQTLYAKAMLAIAPMHAGGGTRIKILEAAAHAVPVVSTCAAANGIADLFPSRAGIAPTHHHFAALCSELAFDRKASDRLGLRARRQALRHHDQRLVARRWREVFRALLRMGRVDGVWSSTIPTGRFRAWR